LPASALISSISSRALFESPAGAGAFIVTAIDVFSCKSSKFVGGNYAYRVRFYPAPPVSAGV
jgi:hypothetical protein